MAEILTFESDMKSSMRNSTNNLFLFSRQQQARIFLVLSCVCSILSGCANVKEAPAPLPVEEERKANFGKAFGEEFLLFGSAATKRTVDQTPVATINTYLWQASLESISFLPLQSADAIGGIIITDWYTVPQTPQERLKITVRIIGKDLRSDALKVLLNRQVKNKDGSWIEAPIQHDIQLKLENIILSKARQLRISNINSSHS